MPGIQIKTKGADIFYRHVIGPDEPDNGLYGAVYTRKDGFLALFVGPGKIREKYKGNKSQAMDFMIKCFKKYCKN